MLKAKRHLAALLLVDEKRNEARSPEDAICAVVSLSVCQLPPLSLSLAAFFFAIFHPPRAIGSLFVQLNRKRTQIRALGTIHIYKSICVCARKAMSKYE